MHTIYIVDRANQLKTESYETKDQAYAAADRWEALAAEVFDNRLQAALRKDEYDRFLRRQSAKVAA